MVSERELVGLLHRADWTKLTLSGTVTGDRQVADFCVNVESDEPPTGPWERVDDGPHEEFTDKAFRNAPPWVSRRMREDMRRARRGPGSGPAWVPALDVTGGERALSVAPGRRFRADGADGAWSLGCDGTRMWLWGRHLPANTTVTFGSLGSDRLLTPYETLLAPSWLLARYSLVIDGEATVAGRAGVRVRGTARAVTERPTWGTSFGRSAGAGGLFAPIPRWVSGIGAEGEEMEAVVDAELGILLRCSQGSPSEPPRVTEFVSVDVPGTTPAAGFSALAGSVFCSGKYGSRSRDAHDKATDWATGPSLGDAVGEALGTVGRGAGKAAVGMAAGGLGALVKYAASRQRVDPFTQAATEAADPDAAMPTDETAPDGPATGIAGHRALTDEVLHAIYRGGLAAPSFSATLHQWFTADAMFDAVPQSVHDAGFGGVGFLLDALRDNARESTSGASHAVSTVRLGGWRTYRIDVERSASVPTFFRSGGRNKDRALTIAGDGERTWHVFADRVMTGPALPLPIELGDLVDASWLLDGVLELSGGTDTWLGGRRAYRIVARYRDEAGTAMDGWKRLFFPAVVVVDAETGLVLRLTRFKGGRPMMRQELRDVAELDADTDFSFTPPNGLPVREKKSRLMEREPDGGWSWSWDPAD